MGSASVLGAIRPVATLAAAMPGTPLTMRRPSLGWRVVQAIRSDPDAVAPNSGARGATGKRRTRAR